MSAADKVLNRLVRVKQTRPDRFSAACPCCESRTGRPISVRSNDDGRVLIHAFCGCSTEAVMDALGLKLADLFDAPVSQYLPQIRGGFSARELIDLLSHEITVAAIIVSDAEKRPMTLPETRRLRQASARIGQARSMIHGG